MSRLMVRSGSFDPYLNLAVESYLLRRWAPTQHLLYLYRNGPSVVVGRHQNIHNECNLPAMRRLGVLPVRRVSGGGAVYHDLGNLNIAFLSPAEEYDQDANYQRVIGALGTLGFAVERNKRNDLLIHGKKISGSAFRHSGGASLQHLTLLVSSDLEQLGGILHGDRTFAYDSKGIASVRSEVSSLMVHDPEYGQAESAVLRIEAALAHSFGPDLPPLHLPGARCAGVPEVQHQRQELKSDTWVFHKCPPFVARHRDLEIQVRDGVIQGIGPLPRYARLHTLFSDRSWHKSMDEILMMFDNGNE